MPDKQHTFGQFETPVDIADLLLGFCLRRPTDRVLDPGCGDGALLQRAAQWQRWMASAPESIPAGTLTGVELDRNTAVSAQTRLPQATILNQNFFNLDPDEQRLYDAIISNPPYTRAEWLDELRQTAAQLTFAWGNDPTTDPETQPIIPPQLWARLSQRAGLYAYFFLHGVRFLREGGRFGLIVPNGWLDVAYGTELKRFLLTQFKIIAIIESGVERWFAQAKVNTCLVVLEKCSGPNRRAENRVRLVRLQRPLTSLIANTTTDYRRQQAVERLVTRLLPAQSRHNDDADVHVVQQQTLLPDARWGLHLRAPTVYLQRREQAALTPLQTWATVQRGYTTGANEFFYLDAKTIDRWGIEAVFRRPILKSLRGLDRLRLTTADCRHELLLPPTANLAGTAVAAYIAWGEQQGFHRRHTCAARPRWYSLPPATPAPIVLPKGVWRRHLAPLLADPLPVDQQLYQVYLAADVPLLAAAACLNSTWFMLQCELHGRINLGAGVLWLAAYELAAISLPDPRAFTAAQAEELGQLFTQLAQRPCLDIEQELDQPDRLALDTAVFNLMGFTASEQTAVHDSLRASVQTRRHRAA